MKQDVGLTNVSNETYYGETIFEKIKHVNEYGQEFWYARELQTALEYKQWRRFCNVIEKAKEAWDAYVEIYSREF